ncbi:MAG: SGNH/GDSL hydrolase family protein [Acidobacteriota bacterium]|nr:SGNH/GDSL hydrolase family protein [Acidobacteriota bacterium]
MQIQIGRVSILLLLPVFVAVCVAPPRGVIILCAGDSITAGGYPHYLQRLLAADGIRARVLNRGRSGNRSAEYLSYLGHNEEELRGLKPDFILLQLGTNDVRTDLDRTPTPEFTANMREILRRLGAFRGRDGLPSRILLAAIPPVPEGGVFAFDRDSLRRVTEEINPAIQDLARAEGLAFVDNHGIFVGRPDLLPDVHPSREGYKALAANWYSALKPLLKAR